MVKKERKGGRAGDVRGDAGVRPIQLNTKSEKPLGRGKGRDVSNVLMEVGFLN